MYWVFVDDNWYASTWYNGPWELVAPDFVPLFILRVPVRYYRHPPYYFRTWYANGPPRWGEHWGGTWEQHHRGWNNWNRAAVPAPAPLPVYQRQYSGTRYPTAGQQYALQTQNYRYQPRDAVVQQHYQTATRAQSAPAPAQQSTVTAAPAPLQRREVQHPTTAPSQQVATPPSRTSPAQVGRTETRPPIAPAPAQQAATPAARGQPPVERSQRPANVPRRKRPRHRRARNRRSSGANAQPACLRRKRRRHHRARSRRSNGANAQPTCLRRKRQHCRRAHNRRSQWRTVSRNGPPRSLPRSGRRRHTNSQRYKEARKATDRRRRAGKIRSEKAGPGNTADR